MNRVGWAVAVGAGLAALSSTSVHADAAGPTDYRTEIVAIAPATDAITVSIEGGDAFVAIDVERGHRVVVHGYDDEPYLLIDETGGVYQNVRSFATYYNQERYGTDEIPLVVDNEAPPEWSRIGGDGSWAWHDHRAHWMGDGPPLGLDPGDALPSQVIPIEVDGVPTEVTVRTTLVAGPSLWPAAFGLVFGLGVGAMAMLAGRATLNLVALTIAAAALWVGVGQYRSLPAATGPMLTWWLLPAMAIACCGAVIAIYGWNLLVEQALTALAGLHLVLWAFQRRSGLTTPVLPTDLPAWSDRTVTAVALAGGATVVAAAVRRMFSP